MASFTEAYYTLRESFMCFTHAHSYNAFQAWWNGDSPFVVESWEFLDPSEREGYMEKLSEIFHLLAECTDWKESVPYFYNEAIGDPYETLDHFFPDIRRLAWYEKPGYLPF